MSHSSTPKKVAIIGCGRIAGHHARSIQRCEQKGDGLTLAAVCDLASEKAKAYGKEFSVPDYTDYRKMLRDDPSIDVVVIATPSGMHSEHALDILKNYRKHLVVEKPTFMKPSQAQEVYQLAKSIGCKIFPVFQNRYNAAVKRVKKALTQGELGEIRLVGVRVRWCRPQRYYDLSPWRGTYAMDGGALTNQGIHHIDLLRYLAGEVTEVNCSMATLGADIEVEDSVVATFKYQRAIGSLEVTTAARPDDFEASISIVGEKGMAQIGGIAVNELQVFTPSPGECAQNSEDFTGSVYGNGHAELYRSISLCLNEGKPYLISEDDCVQSIRLLHSFYVSAENQNWVKTADRLESKKLGKADEALAQLYRTE